MCLCYIVNDFFTNSKVRQCFIKFNHVIYWIDIWKKFRLKLALVFRLLRFSSMMNVSKIFYICFLISICYIYMLAWFYIVKLSWAKTWTYIVKKYEIKKVNKSFVGRKHDHDEKFMSEKMWLIGKNGLCNKMGDLRVES